MRTISDTSISTLVQSGTHSQQVSRYTTDEQRRVNRFFSRLQTIYGHAKYRTQFPDRDAEKLAKREWADQILRKTDEQLDRKLSEAKAMINHPDYRWPNIGLILAGPDVIEAGEAARSFRPADDVLQLAAPKKDKTRGEQALADMMSGL